MPQASIRFLIFVIGVSALVMYTFRAAVVGDHFWAKIASLLLATTMGCFVAYAAVFFAAYVFAISMYPLHHVIQASQSDPVTEQDVDAFGDGES